MSKLTKTKTRSLRYTGYINSIKPYEASFIANPVLVQQQNFLIVNFMSYCCQYMLLSIAKRYVKDLVRIYIFWSSQNSGEVLDKGTLNTAFSDYKAIYCQVLIVCLFGS